MPPAAEIFTQEKQAIEYAKTGSTGAEENLSAVLHRTTDSGGDFQPFPLETIEGAGVMKNEITITRRGILISKHASGVICAYDSRHRILKVRLQGGVIAELVQERTGTDTICGKFRNQLLTVNNGSDASVIEF